MPPTIIIITDIAANNQNAQLIGVEIVCMRVINFIVLDETQSSLSGAAIAGAMQLSRLDRCWHYHHRYQRQHPAITTANTAILRDNRKILRSRTLLLPTCKQPLDQQQYIT